MLCPISMEIRDLVSGIIKIGNIDDLEVEVVLKIW